MGAATSIDFASAACAPWVSKYSDSFMRPIISDALIAVNSIPRIPLVSKPLKNGTMQRIEEIYRLRLQMLVVEAGSQAALSKQIDKSPAQISQWINASKDSKTGKPRSMDRATARAIEKMTGKPDGWMDQPIGNTSTLWPFPSIEKYRFDRLTDEQKIEIQGVVRERIESYEHPKKHRKAA